MNDNLLALIADLYGQLTACQQREAALRDQVDHLQGALSVASAPDEPAAEPSS